MTETMQIIDAITMAAETITGGLESIAIAILVYAVVVLVIKAPKN